MLLRVNTPPTPLVSSQTSLALASLISSSAAVVQGELARNTLLRIFSEVLPDPGLLLMMHLKEAS